MDVLIICANRHQHPAAVIPYGACITAEAAARAGHEVRLLDLMFRRNPLEAVESALRRHAPQVVGVSVRNLDNNDMYAPVEFVSELTALVETVRRFSDAALVLGGPAVGVMPEPLLRHTGADWAVLGDGEVAFPALLQALGNGGPSQVPRLAWLENGHLRTGSEPPCPLVDEALLPRFHRWIDLRAYLAAMVNVPLQSKRGCPFPCIYCTYGISEGRQYRLLPPDEVADAVDALAASGIRDIEFVDNVFNSPYEHALGICESLARGSRRARLQTLELNPAFVDDRLLAAMERAGFVGIGITAESAADETLAGLQKGYGAAEVARAAAAVGRSRLPCCWIFLLGGPGETEQTVEETLRFAQRTVRKGDVAFFSVGLRIYPGTELESLARRQGLLTRSAQEMLEPVFYFSPALDPAWTVRRVRQAAAANLRLLHGALFSHPWLPAIHRLCHRLPLKRPLWRHTPTIRRVVRALGRDL